MCVRAARSRENTLAETILDGIATRYEVLGSGPPLLMYSPAGFDATLDKWRTQGVYARIGILDMLAQRYRCIVFDRRESGGSGGRIERLTWAGYAAQGRGLLEHLKIRRAHLLGGCMGCCPVVAFGVAHPEMVMSMILYWPVGGAKFRINSQLRFARHLAYVHEHGLRKVVDLVKSCDATFSQDPRGGPWTAVIRNDPAFAESFARQDVEKYSLVVTGTVRTLFDRDTAPGAEPEDLLRLELPALIIPGQDASHATSAARYLEECLARAEYWDAPVAVQTESTAPARILSFLDRVGAESR